MGPKTMFYSVEYDAPEKHVELDFPFVKPKIHEIVGIGNGLLCLVEYPQEGGDLMIFAWNPYKKYILSIPAPDDSGSYKTKRYGFGYNKQTNEHKVVCILYPWGSSQGHVHVCTIGNDWSWKRLDSTFYISRDHFPNALVSDHFPNALVNGDPHWIGVSQHQKSILSFSIKNETLQQIQLPGDVLLAIGELNGFLCVFQHIPEIGVHIHMMKEYGIKNSWTKQFTIAQLEVPKPLIDHLDPIAILETGEILVMRRYNVQLILYEPVGKSVKKELNSPGFRFKAYRNTKGHILPGVNIQQMSENEEQEIEDEIRKGREETEKGGSRELMD
ncbi:hypothetical protein ACHQM5_030868 [Ranunculus cassubicifolius]